MKTRKLILNIAVVMGLGVLSGQSWAGCIIYGGSTITIDVVIPDIAVLPDATIGSLLSSVTVPNKANASVGCNARSWWFFKHGTSRTLKSGGGLPPGVYEIKNTDNEDSGVGVRVTSHTLIPVATNNNGAGRLAFTDAASGGMNITGVKIEFYKTGDIKPGDLQFPRNFIEGWMSTSQWNTSGGALFYILNVNSPKVKAGGCETPGFTVPMGKHPKSDFSGVGSTSSATPFTFSINNCDAGLNSVKFTFKPASGITLEDNGLPTQHLTVKSGTNAATGIGVQVLYANDNSLVPFGTKLPSGYIGTAGSFAVPMKARYIQTAPTITAGNADSALEFTMSYD